MIIIITVNIGLSSWLLALGQSPATNTDGWATSREVLRVFFPLKDSTINSQILLSSINPEVFILLN